MKLEEGTIDSKHLYGRLIMLKCIICLNKCHMKSVYKSNCSKSDGLNLSI